MVRIYKRKDQVNKHSIRVRESRDNRRKPCPLCGSLIDPRSKLCRNCWVKTNVGANHHNWKGKGTIHGYTWVRMPEHPKSTKAGLVLEHILVWEQFNGQLPNGCCIHHINGIRNDNRIENLMAIDFSNHSRQHSQSRPTILKLRAAQKRIRELETQLATKQML